MHPRMPIAALAALLWSTTACATEGMWVPQQLPQIADALEDAGLRLDPDDLADLAGDPMGAVVSLGGCTASFVSKQGLAITNHHCAYGAIQLNSTPDNNLMREGFNAAKRGDELAAGPNARIYALESIEDVTARVRAAIDAAPDALARTRALDGIEKRLVAECEAGGGHRCRLYSFLGGNTWRLFRNIEIRDVRLVYAPPGGIGNFGGEIDNWMWPRHSGDFAFYRAYVGKDGRPAPFSEDNVPYQPKHWLAFAEEPLREGDFVMLAGYPGRTSRHALAVEFDDAANWTYPTLAAHYRKLVALVDAAGIRNPDIAVKYASTVRGWENAMKNYDGQVEGFERIGAAVAKQHDEAALLAWLRKRGNKGKPALEAHAKLVALAGRSRATRERDLVVARLDSTGVLDAAITLYRRAIEHEKPDAEREAGYQQRNDARIEGELKQMERRYVPEMDRELQRYWLTQYIALPRAQRVGALDEWLGGDEDGHVGRAIDRLAKTKLGDTEERLRWLDAGREAFESSDDPAIRYAVAIMPALLERERERKLRAGEELQARPVYLRALAGFRESQGGAVYPDANASLRITYGHVKPYTKLNGVKQLPFTTLEQIAAKATGEEPFAAPQPLLDAIAARRYGGLADPRFGSVPVNFLADLDITGGNSGSPVVDAHGRLVGLAFDMNWEAVVSNWVFDPEMTRAIAVDARYVRWVMQEAWPAPQLLEELGLAPAGQ